MHDRHIARTRNSLALCMLLSTGCSTLSGLRQPVSVDSEPRGLPVFDPQTHLYMGTTPFFANLRRSRSQSFVIGETTSAEINTLSCSFRPTPTLLGNLPLAFFSFQNLYGLLYATAVATDLSTRSAWNCPIAISLRTHPGVAQPTKVCKKYLVFPPTDVDEKYARYISDAWRDKFASGFSACDSFVSSEESEKIFAMQGISSWERNQPESFEREEINRLGLQTQASHAVFLRHWKDSANLWAQAAIVDMHRLNKAEFPPLAVARSETYPAPSPVVKFLSHALRLVPNSISYSFNGRNNLVVEKRNSDVQNISPESRERLPPLISNWSIFSVKHPSQFNDWDIDAGVFPFFNIKYINNNIRYDFKKEPRSVRAELLVFRAFLQSSLVGYTPLGATSVELGGGLLASTERTGHTQHSLRGSPGFSLTLAYSAFLSSQVFLRIPLTATFSSRPLYQNKDVKTKEILTANVSLGLYVPQTRFWLRSIF